jgi:hypothetical protein
MPQTTAPSCHSKKETLDVEKFPSLCFAFWLLNEKETRPKVLIDVYIKATVMPKRMG